MRSVAVRWTTKAAVAEGRGGVASSSGILATVATARDGSPGYHAFDNKQKTERVAGSGALGQQFRDSNLVDEIPACETEVASWLMNIFLKKDQLFSKFMKQTKDWTMLLIMFV
ncbi:uncharacterized protein LOC130933689 isoform X2 [Arachis stenosperma]|uniref:uncharacterized protein LOC130933689 isoform X2 n=1 Tax=Arachis stenosperma TaxID=217475 RepID=UPI0025ABC96A|nr:uncharacterized protein LOC130933689 isoform X2 [Arachis stenosperma]